MSWADEAPPLDAYSDDQQPHTPRAAAVAVLPVPEPPERPLFRPIREILGSLRAPVYLIKGVLEVGAIGMLYGQSGSGKSFVGVDWACSIATGKHWHDIPVKRGAVVILAGEGFGGLDRRLAAWNIKYPAANLADAHLFVTRRTVPFDETAKEIILAAIKDSGTTPTLIEIDTINRHLVGDENSAKDAADFIRVCGEIQSEIGAAILLIHHEGVQSGRARGSTAFRASMDSEVYISMDKGVIEVSCKKAKDEQMFPSMYFSLENVKLPIVNEDNEDVYSAVPVPADAPDAEETLNANTDHALTVLRGMWAEYQENMEGAARDTATVRVAVKDWKESARLAKSTFHRAKDALIESGKIELIGRSYVRLKSSSH
jgi:hypothetical protein